MVELVKQEEAAGAPRLARVKAMELSAALDPCWRRRRTWEGTTTDRATADIREARLGRASHRAQVIQGASIGSRAITVAPAAMVLQEVTAGTYKHNFSKSLRCKPQCSRGGGSSAYNPPREPSYSNSYGGGGGAVNSSTATNYGSNFGASTTNYSPYTGSNSYSSTSNKSSSQQSSSNYSSSAATTSTGPSSQFSGESGSTTAGSGKTGNSYDSTQTSSSAGTYGGVGQSSSSSVSSLGLSANSTLSSASKMSVNTTSGKMVPGMPPGVPGVLPAQYMIGANAAAGIYQILSLWEQLFTLKHNSGFPAYLANLGQAPAMAAYGGYGVGGHQLEDLAALQRSTLAASLPQLVGSQAGGAAGTPAPGKGVRGKKILLGMLTTIMLF